MNIVPDLKSTKCYGDSHHSFIAHGNLLKKDTSTVKILERKNDLTFLAGIYRIVGDF